MSIRHKVFLGFLCLIALSVITLVNLVVSDLEPRYRETVEEPLVDFSTLLASILEIENERGGNPVSLLSQSIERARSRTLQARIFEHLKSSIDLRAYLTDEKGQLLFDSENTVPAGTDYSEWRDVRMTLEGGYGARTSRDLPDYHDSSVMYVAAPVHKQPLTETVAIDPALNDPTLFGVVSIGKPTKSFQEFINKSKSRLIITAASICLVMLAIALLLSRFLSRPIEKLTDYAHAIANGQRPPLPQVGGGEIKKLEDAFELMRESLEGKRYVEHYVETLTHEIKSPLSAIRGAAELLSEPMPIEDQKRFLDNIRNESSRMQQLVDKLLLLSSLEARKTLKETAPIDCLNLIQRIIDSLASRLQSKNINITFSGTASTIQGETFLVDQALRNVIENAFDFSPAGGVITIQCSSLKSSLEITIEDQGPGIPDYALTRVFDRFYSLARPGTDRKSTGLGLSFVKEVVELHLGSVKIENIKSGGARATLTFPIAQA